MATTRSTTGATASVPQYEQRDETQELLARQFFDTFPQLEGLRFTHRWGGPIATTTRFTLTAGTAHGGRVAYAVGYTGLGVGASRFGARVALDLLGGEPTELTRLRFVRRKPLPFPPEPLRSLRHRPHPAGHRVGRPPRRPPRPLAAHPRPLRRRLRQLTERSAQEAPEGPRSDDDGAGGA